MPSYSTFFEASEPHLEKAPNTKITCDKNKKNKSQNAKINHTHTHTGFVNPSSQGILGSWDAFSSPVEMTEDGESWSCLVKLGDTRVERRGHGRIGVFFSEMEPIWTQLQRKYGGGLVSKGGVCVCFFLVGKIFADQLFAYHFCLRTKFFHVVEAFTYRIVLGNESQTHGSG